MKVFSSLFGPSVDELLMNITKTVIFLMTCFFGIMIYVDYNIHYLIMCMLSFCFFLSFQYFSIQLKKHPEVLLSNNKEKKE